MRRLANIFLILFLVDGIVSSADELFCIFAHPGMLAGIRHTIAWLVIFLSVPVYLSLGVDRRWPKLIFLPQLFFIFWKIVRLWPLPVMFPRSSYALAAASGQVLLGAAPLLYLRLKSGQHFLLTKKRYNASFFSLKNTILFIAGNLAMLPAALIFIAVAATSIYLYGQSGGFACLKPDGLHMKEKIYRLADKQIRLTSMIHIAEKDYFDDLVNSISAEHTVILAEGVTDRDNLLSYRFGYG